jgi:8-oxo-dGTP diphosphatase
MEFHGVKIAVMVGEKLLMHLRDDKPGLRFANMWDFPGGGREGVESPIECALREIKEEFEVTLTEDSFIWQKQYPAMHDPDAVAFFMVANAMESDIESIVLHEGQGWKLFDVHEFFGREDVVPKLKQRFQDYLDHKSSNIIPYS